MKILCLGDSNTYGYDPRSFFGGCYDMPWPQLLSEKSGWCVQNLGENGREIPRYPRNIPTDIDLLVIMLGTNDLLQGNSVESIKKRMRSFLEGIDFEAYKILLIAPPPMKLGEWVPTQSLVEDSKELAIEYQSLAQEIGAGFVNAGQWNIPMTFDGVHFTQEGHRTFAEGLYKYLIKEGVYSCFGVK